MNNYMKTIISGLKQWVSSQKSDWNQSDDSATNYIKNRTHYTTGKKETILNETTLGAGFTNINLLKALKNNQKYIVKLNNSEYECISYEMDGENGIIFIGNKLAISGEDTGIPFTIGSMGIEASIVIYDESISSCTFSILEDQEIVKKLDEKYLPDGLVLKKDVYTKDEVYTKDKVFTKWETYYENSYFTKQFRVQKDDGSQDYFYFKDRKFYKISDFVPLIDAIDDKIRCHTSDNVSYDTKKWASGKGCYCFGNADLDIIIVNDAGRNSLPIDYDNNPFPTNFEAPSNGMYTESKQTNYLYSVDFKLTLFMAGIYIDSPTGDKAIIAVNEDGALTTEHTDGTFTEMATKPYVEDALDDVVYTGEDSEPAAEIIDADTLGGIPASEYVTKNSTRAVGSGISDWKANEGEPGYILNRTHYDNGTEQKVLLDTTVTVADNLYASNSHVVPIIPGNTYIVTWDGIEYECEAIIDSQYGMPALGNTLFEGGEDNGMPFSFVDFQTAHGQDGYMLLFGGAAMTDGTHTIKITKEVKAYKTLEECYLPASAKAYVLKLPANSMSETPFDDNAKNFYNIDNVSYDEFADILWNGGELFIDFSNFYPDAATTNGSAMRLKVVSWWFYADNFHVYLTTPREMTTSNGETISYLGCIELMFVNGTWKIPATE